MGRGAAEKGGCDYVDPQVKAQIYPWPHNAMRHSFGSYFLGKTKDENLTASEMGNSPEVIIKHYRALVRDADVTQYWRLAPGNLHEGSASTQRLQHRLTESTSVQHSRGVSAL